MQYIQLVIPPRICHFLIIIILTNSDITLRIRDTVFCLINRFNKLNLSTSASHITLTYEKQEKEEERAEATRKKALYSKELIVCNSYVELMDSCIYKW